MWFVLGAGPLTRAGRLWALHIDPSSLRQGWQLSRKAGMWSGRPWVGHRGVAVRGMDGLVVAHAAGQAVAESGSRDRRTFPGPRRWVLSWSFAVSCSHL